MPKDTYERKISSEEAAEGYVLIEKAALKVFPPVGTPFELSDGGTKTAAKVEARDCECRGPDKPHQHYFIRRPGLARGARWRFTREGETFRLDPL